MKGRDTSWLSPLVHFAICSKVPKVPSLKWSPLQYKAFLHPSSSDLEG